MPWYDLPAEQLAGYRTGTQEPAELDLWWQRHLDEARAAAAEPTLTRYEAGAYGPLEVYDGPSPPTALLHRDSRIAH